MRPPIQILLLVAIGCSPQQSKVVREVDATTAPLAIARTESDFSTAEGVSAILEQRWSIDSIRAFCIPDRRHNEAFQNLVAFGNTWDGELYANTDTGFDRIFWYATTQNNILDEYSLNVQRGNDYWLLEIGNMRTTETPPQIAPDPSQPFFVGAEK